MTERTPITTPALPGGLPFDATQIQFTPAGTGAVARPLQTVERAVARSGDYSTAANFLTAVNSLTEAFGAASLNIGLQTGWTIAGQKAAFPDTAINFVGIKNPVTTTVHQTNYFVVLGQDDNNTTDNIAPLYSAFYDNHPTGTRASAVGFEGDIFMTGGGTTTGIAGVIGFSQVVSGTVFTQFGIQGEISISGGTITHAAGGYSIVIQSAGAITNSYGYLINPPNRTGGTVTNNYGLYIDYVGTGGSSKNYQFYCASVSNPVIIDSTGKLGVGGAPAFLIHSYGGDVATNVLFAGITKGIRFGASSAGSTIEGVDNTGSASYQPLAIGGSAVAITASGVTLATFTAGLQMGTPTGGDKGAGTINAAGAYYANGTVGVNFGPAAVASITVKNGIVTAIS